MSKNWAAVRVGTADVAIGISRGDSRRLIGTGLYAARWLEKEAKNASMSWGAVAGKKLPAVKGAAGAMRAARGA